MAGEVEVAVAAAAELAEGPSWDARAQRLRWVDIEAGLVHTYCPVTGRDSSEDVGIAVGAVVPRRGGGLALAIEDGFALSDGPADRLLRRHRVDEPDGNRMNDGKCDRDGRFFAGTMARDQTPGAGALYRLDPDGRVERVRAGVTISNGLGWSPDGATMYYVDSPTHVILAFDYDRDTAAMTAERVLAELDPGEGMPDGLTVDAEGCLWVARWGGARVDRIAPDGRRVDTVRLPASHVTSCAFGGPELAELYITTARMGLSDQESEEQPEAGHVFVCDPGVIGMPSHACAA